MRASKYILSLMALGVFVGVTGYGIQLLVVELVRVHAEVLVLSTRAVGLT
jgi:hypothetical protein